MADAKATICYLNGLSLRTINEVEKILRDLPKKGDRCGLQWYTGVKRGTANIIASKGLKIGEESNTDLSSMCSTQEIMSKPPRPDVNRCAADVFASKSLQTREPKPFSLSPPCTKTGDDVSRIQKNSGFSCMSSTQEVQKKEVHTTITTLAPSVPLKKSGSKVQCKVLTDEVRVSPIVSCNGVVLELDVEVTVPNQLEKKHVKLEIECPNFVPTRIKIGNKWKNIV